MASRFVRDLSDSSTHPLGTWEVNHPKEVEGVDDSKVDTIMRQMKGIVYDGISFSYYPFDVSSLSIGQKQELSNRLDAAGYYYIFKTSDQIRISPVFKNNVGLFTRFAIRYQLHGFVFAGAAILFILLELF